MSTIKKKKNNNKYIIIVAIIAVIMIATMCIIVRLIIKGNNSSKNTSNTQITNNNKVINDNDDNINEENEIEMMTEPNRMKRYIGIFFEDIEEENYKKAYDVLNQEFKSTYFPTLEKFTEYASKYFKKEMVGVTYDNIERLGNNKTGNMYVLWLTMIYKNNPGTETKFVIIENDYNNYEMSFSVNFQ